jgi:hypothetical protein
MRKGKQLIRLPRKIPPARRENHTPLGIKGMRKRTDEQSGYIGHFRHHIHSILLLFMGFYFTSTHLSSTPIPSFYLFF